MGLLEFVVALFVLVAVIAIFLTIHYHGVKGAVAALKTDLAQVEQRLTSHVNSPDSPPAPTHTVIVVPAPTPLVNMTAPDTANKT